MICARTAPAMLLVSLAFGVSTSLATSARADRLCADVTVLLSDFGHGTGTSHERKLSDADSCATSLSLDGLHSFYCFWEFPYRSEDVQNTFNDFDRSLRQCFADRATAVQDQAVNHPDFYDLRQYQMASVTVSLSLKDKGALQKSYVFVRLDEIDPD